MEDEVEITVIATGFSGSTVSDDMKKDIIRTVSHDIRRADDYANHEQDVKVNNLYDEKALTNSNAKYSELENACRPICATIAGGKQSCIGWKKVIQ